MPDRYKIGIVGLGAIGLQIAKTIDGGDLPNLDLAAFSIPDSIEDKINSLSIDFSNATASAILINSNLSDL